MATGGEKRAALLRQIREEGGFAFVASAEKAAAGDLRAAEAAREMAWEQLHSAPWGEVEPAWRDAYALACLHVAGIRAGDDRRAALRALDMGLIMGGGLLRAELEDAVARVVADHRGSDEGETGGFCGDVEKWKEGLAGDRDLADETLLPHQHEKPRVTRSHISMPRPPSSQRWFLRLKIASQAPNAVLLRCY